MSQLQYSPNCISIINIVSNASVTLSFNLMDILNFIAFLNHFRHRLVLVVVVKFLEKFSTRFSDHIYRSFTKVPTLNSFKALKNSISNLAESR